MRDDIARLKHDLNAVVLAHNYQRPEVQDIADFVGDSLNLSRKAMETKADIIVFCGVDFMAETAKILNPDKKVLVPEPRAACPMAAALSLDDLRKAQKEHPDAETVLYVNTRAEAKALCDCVCTSANAPKVVNCMDAKEIIFGPDSNLGYFVSKQSKKKIINVPEYGLCPTHQQITLADVVFAREDHPGAFLLAHPECIPQVQDLADHIASTEGMVSFARSSKEKEFIIATENGLLHRLRKEAPGKKFFPASQYTFCPNMKMTTLDKVLHVLKTQDNELLLDKRLMDRARAPIKRMLALS